MVCSVWRPFSVLSLVDCFDFIAVIALSADCKSGVFHGLKFPLLTYPLPGDSLSLSQARTRTESAHCANRYSERNRVLSVSQSVTLSLCHTHTHTHTHARTHARTHCDTLVCYCLSAVCLSVSLTLSHTHTHVYVAVCLSPCLPLYHLLHHYCGSQCCYYCFICSLLACRLAGTEV